MELRHLRYFVAVAEEENVTRAAARLHVSQPPVSRQLRDLEDELGLQLFERRPKSLRLTKAGRIFLIEARSVLARVDEALQVASTLAGRQKGEIHVGYAPSLTVDILPRALRYFNRITANHEVSILLHDFSTEEMLAGLREKTLNVALMIRPATTALKGLNFEVLRRQAVCLAAHPAHPLSSIAKIGLPEVARERLLVYAHEEYPEYHAWLENLFKKNRLNPKIGDEHDSALSLIASVESGCGVALVQEGFDCLSGPRLLVRPLDPPPPPFIIGMAWRQEHAHGPTTKFLDATRLAVKNAPPT